jgi:hypothetical protein
MKYLNLKSVVVTGILSVFIDIAIICAALQVIIQQAYLICTIYCILYEETELLMI